MSRPSAAPPSWRRRRRCFAASPPARFSRCRASWRCLDLADAASIPVVAVTNAPRANAELILQGLGITRRFRAVIIGDELPHGKPHPLPYLEGLRAVDASPKSSLAFEDSRAGITAATAAGLATVGMRTNLGHDDLIAAGAAITAAGFDEPDVLALLMARLGGAA